MVNCKSILASAALASSLLCQTPINSCKGDTAVTNIQTVVLAAGASSRLRSGRSKLLEPLCGQPLILHITSLLEKMSLPTVVVVNPAHDELMQLLTKHHPAITFGFQPTRTGTGGAVQSALPALHSDHILIINGDMPLIQEETLTALITKHLSSESAVSFVASYATDAGIGFGRVIENEHSISIIEYKHLDPELNPRDYPINAGIYLIQRTFLEHALSQLEVHELSNEMYLPDIIEQACNEKLPIAITYAEYDTIRGVNTYAELATAEEIKQQTIIEQLMNQGVRFIAPRTNKIDINVLIKRGSVIDMGAHIIGFSEIGENCLIGPYSIVRDSRLADNVTVYEHSIINWAIVETHAEIGPFAHVQGPRTRIGEKAVIGNFVEIKRSIINNKVKAKHLSYIGDADIGEATNIGAGMVACNYDGQKKHQTTIGKNAFIGSNSTIIAPVTIEEGAFIAAGSTITEDVPAHSLAIARQRQTNKIAYRAAHIESPDTVDNEQP